MRKNQNGVSMVSLVITIIVMIILAAVAFGSSTETISNASFADFQNDITEVEQMVQTKVTTVHGNMKAEGNNVNLQQVRNWVAKGASEEGASGEEAMLPMSVAAKLTATQINPNTAKAVFENDLPAMTVNTANASKVKVSYFLTKSGKVFIWPPYLNDTEDAYYMNKEDKVVLYTNASGDTETTVGLVEASKDDEVLAMFGADVYVKVGEDIIHIKNTQAEPSTTTGSEEGANKAKGLSMNNAKLAENPVVFYNDIPKATSPRGIEIDVASFYSTALDVRSAS